MSKLPAGSANGIIEEQEGVISKEVLVLIRWKSEAYWKQWEKRDAHIGHKEKQQQPKSEFILNIEVGKYELVLTIK